MVHVYIIIINCFVSVGFVIGLATLEDYKLWELKINRIFPHLIKNARTSFDVIYKNNYFSESLARIVLKNYIANF